MAMDWRFWQVARGTQRHFVPGVTSETILGIKSQPVLFKAFRNPKRNDLAGELRGNILVCLSQENPAIQ